MLLGNLAAVALLLVLAWRPRVATVGLPLCYLLSLGTIHFVGAWVSTLPASPAGNALFIAHGFRECFAGVVAFTAAVLVTDFVLLRPRSVRIRDSRTCVRRRSSRAGAQLSSSGPSRQPPRWAKSGRGLDSEIGGVPLAYVAMGVACVLASPLFKPVPSLAALVHCGAYLIVAGCCMGCFFAWRNRRRARFLSWVACTCLFPAFTILTTGFIGYGVFASLMVLSFAMMIYRPRWQALASLIALAYVALSVYVTYMRGRDQMREAVWGGQAYSTRLGQLREVFARFEFFRPNDGAQLQAIDDRLNQNYLVGAACSQLENGLVPWARGRTIWRAVLALVPRILWPGKPVVAGGENIVSEYTGLSFAEFTSVGVGQVMEFYINFGRLGVIAGFCLLGVLLRFLDWRAALCLQAARHSGFVLWYLPGLAFMQTGGSLVEVSGTCAASVLVALAARRLDGPFVRGRLRRLALPRRFKPGLEVARTEPRQPEVPGPKRFSDSKRKCSLSA